MNTQSKSFPVKDFGKFEKLMIPRTAFRRVLLEIDKGRRWNENAIDAMHHAAEYYLENVFGAAAMCAEHAQRATLLVKDIRLARKIRGDL